MRPYHLLALSLGVAFPVSAQVDAVTVPIGTPVFLVTTVRLSSKTSVKGDMVPLQVAEDVIVAGQVILPHGSEAMGQIADARAKGAMGMSGQLLVRPLYAKAGDRIIRLSGQTSDKASVTAGAVIGTIASGMPVFTGRSASIPSGARLSAMVERTVILPIEH